MEDKINYKPIFNQDTEYVCVEYPGVVENDKNMLATLGGIKHLENVYNDPSKRLDMRFRPGDPGCKPLCGDKVQSTSLLLKVSKYRRKKKNDDTTENPEVRYQQTICGIVNSTYKFSTLCDYQYLSLRKNEDNGNIESMIPHIVINSSTFKKRDFFTQKVPLFLPPPTYGRLDTPHAYRYKNEAVKFRRKPAWNRKTTFWNKISSRKTRRNNCISVAYEDEVPTEGLPQALDVVDGIRGDIATARKEIVEHFKRRPVWSRNALQVTLDYGSHFLKVLLPTVAYYVTSGPWARLWVRFGYDPKLDPEARKYQQVDFRLRQGIHTPHIPIKAKRSALNYKLPHLTSKPHQIPRPMSSFAPSEGKSGDASPPESKKKKLPKSVFIYEHGVLPAHRQIFYQACDILLPEAQALLAKVPPGEPKCTKEDGWLVPNTQAEVRNVITLDLYKTLAEIKQGSSGDAQKDIDIPKEADELLDETIDDEDVLDDSENEDFEDDSGSDGSDDSEQSKETSQDGLAEEEDDEIEEEVSDEESEDDEEDAEACFEDETLDEEDDDLGAAALFGQGLPPK